jgi:glutathione-regulated potassium-efflux system protein KefB
MLEVVMLLAAAVVIVPIMQKLGFGSVLGYLLAGLLIGPAELRLVTEVEHVSEASELGVVFLLFIIGLELDPKRLWSWRYNIFGMGTGQILLVTAIVTAASVVLGFSWQAGV